ncbi:MAG: UvrD-helicase domain-containing protein [Rickettsiales bacterium]|nr:UvrD-helicase domain-containing protein [Rickettsiales bacterium]
MKEILQNLNKEQIEAVLYNSGPLLLLAGTGTGKTRVITSKIAYIIKSNLSYPSQILAVTFTNKAANEMKERVAAMSGLDVNSMWIGTFHSISVRILRQYSDLIGIDKNFTIIDQSEQVSIVKQIIKDLKLDTKEYQPKQYVEAISKLKDKTNININSYYLFNEIFTKYEERLKKLNACDFSDLLLYTIKLFKEQNKIKEYYNDKFKHIFVDEYQDTNYIQQEWLKLITGNDINKNITCVGDDDQSIYGWRGAQIKNILNFTNNFSNAKILKLERNYRSTQNILDVASSIISNNKNRHPKTLFANNKDGNKVNLVKCNTTKQEALFIVKEINNLKKNLVINNYKDSAILVRAGYQTRVFEEIFLECKIPYIIIGGLKFYDRKEIKDCIAYLKLINNTSDDLSFERIINIPKRGIGSVTINKIRDFSIENNLSMLDGAVSLCYNNIIKGKTKEEIINFVNKIKEWHINSKHTNLKNLMQIILCETKFCEYIEKDNDIDLKNKQENIKEFLKVLSDFGNIEEFLEHVSLVNDNNKQNITDAVNILTIHSAKGLEFDTVFLPNWQEEIFPSSKSINESIIDNNIIEEERRLAYVAITRAMNNLYISYSTHQFECGEYIATTVSRFVNEIPEELLNITNTTSNYYNDYKQNYSYAGNYGNSYNNSYNVNNLIYNKQSNKYKKCFHKKFGYGYILKEDGDKLTIVFEKSGEKTILKSFIEIVDN